MFKIIRDEAPRTLSGITLPTSSDRPVQRHPDLTVTGLHNNHRPIGRFTGLSLHYPQKIGLQFGILRADIFASGAVAEAIPQVKFLTKYGCGD